MEIKFYCTNPDCNMKLSVDQAHAGSHINCPMCNTDLVVPGETEVAPVAEPASTPAIPQVPEPVFTDTEIKFYCSNPQCGNKLSVELAWAGLQIQCPICSRNLKVPGQARPRSGEDGDANEELIFDDFEVPVIEKEELKFEALDLGPSSAPEPQKVETPQPKPQPEPVQEMPDGEKSSNALWQEVAKIVSPFETLPANLQKITAMGPAAIPVCIGLINNPYLPDNRGEALKIDDLVRVLGTFASQTDAAAKKFIADVARGVVTLKETKRTETAVQLAKTFFQEWSQPKASTSGEPEKSPSGAPLPWVYRGQTQWEMGPRENMLTKGDTEKMSRLLTVPTDLINKRYGLDNPCLLGDGRVISRFLTQLARLSGPRNVANLSVQPGQVSGVVVSSEIKFGNGMLRFSLERFGSTCVALPLFRSQTDAANAALTPLRIANSGIYRLTLSPDGALFVDTWPHPTPDWRQIMKSFEKPLG